MKFAGRIAAALSLALWLASCGGPVHNVFRDESFMKPEPGRAAWRRVAFLPFTGEPAYRRVAAEWLAFRARKLGLFEVVDPSLAEVELGKRGIRFGEPGTSAKDALEAGRLLGADGVVSGAVVPPARGRNGPPSIAASVLDTAAGRIVADTRWAATVPIPFGADLVMGAANRVADDLVPVYYAAVGKTWTPPKDGEAGPATEPAEAGR